MNPDLEQRGTLKFGFRASLMLTFLTLVTFGLAMIAIPPAGAYCPGDCMSYPFSDLLSYYPRDYFWMYLAIFQLFAYLILIISIHYILSRIKNLYSFISISFALISTTVLLIAYFTQFSVVPISMMKGESEGIALITQYNEHGLFIALEELGYITMSISFLFLAPVFPKKKGLGKSIRIILYLQFVLMIFAFILYTIKFGVDRGYRFEVAIITIDWLVTITIGILVCVFIKRTMKITE